MVKYKDGGEIPAYDIRMSKEQLVKLMKTRGLKIYASETMYNGSPNSIMQKIKNDESIAKYLEQFRNYKMLELRNKIEDLEKIEPKGRKILLLKQDEKMWELFDLDSPHFQIDKFFSSTVAMKNMPEPEFSKLAGYVLSAEVGLAKSK